MAYLLILLRAFLIGNKVTAFMVFLASALSISGACITAADGRNHFS